MKWQTIETAPETDMEMVLRTRKRLDEFVAHLDEGGKFSSQNILELIADAQNLGNRLEHRAIELTRGKDDLSESSQ